MRMERLLNMETNLIKSKTTYIQEKHKKIFLCFCWLANCVHSTTSLSLHEKKYAFTEGASLETSLETSFFMV